MGAKPKEERVERAAGADRTLKLPGVRPYHPRHLQWILSFGHPPPNTGHPRRTIAVAKVTPLRDRAVKLEGGESKAGVEAERPLASTPLPVSDSSGLTLIFPTFFPQNFSRTSISPSFVDCPPFFLFSPWNCRYVSSRVNHGKTSPSGGNRRWYYVSLAVYHVILGSRVYKITGRFFRPSSRSRPLWNPRYAAAARKSLLEADSASTFSSSSHGSRKIKNSSLELLMPALTAGITLFRHSSLFISRAKKFHPLILWPRRG